VTPTSQHDARLGALFTGRCRLALLGCMLALALSPAALRGQPAAVAPERDVKAAYLFKFLGYVEWRAAAFRAPRQPIVVGVMDADDIAGDLSDLASGRSVNDRPVQVRRLRISEPLAGLHVLFVGAADHGHVPELVNEAQVLGILTVTETDDGLAQGSVINLVMVDGRVRFEVALDAAERAGIKLSSRLLSVAHLVRMGTN